MSFLLYLDKLKNFANESLCGPLKLINATKDFYMPLKSFERPIELCCAQLCWIGLVIVSMRTFHLSCLIVIIFAGALLMSTKGEIVWNVYLHA